jgi:hypothetical protein
MVCLWLLCAERDTGPRRATSMVGVEPRNPGGRRRDPIGGLGRDAPHRWKRSSLETGWGFTATKVVSVALDVVELAAAQTMEQH